MTPLSKETSRREREKGTSFSPSLIHLFHPLSLSGVFVGYKPEESDLRFSDFTEIYVIVQVVPGRYSQPRDAPRAHVARAALLDDERHTTI